MKTRNLLVTILTICTFGFALSSYAVTRCPKTPQEAEAGGWVVYYGNIDNIKAIGFDHAEMTRPTYNLTTESASGRMHCIYGFLKRSAAVSLVSSFNVTVHNITPFWSAGWYKSTVDGGSVYCGEWCDPTLTKCTQPKNCSFTMYA